MWPEPSSEEARLNQELPATEQRNPASARLDEMNTEEILRLINAEDRKVSDVVERALPRISQAVEILVVRAVLCRLGDLAVYPSGGVFRATTMRERVEEALKRSRNDVEVKDTVNADPLDGVFSIARRGIR